MTGGEPDGGDVSAANLAAAASIPILAVGVVAAILAVLSPDASPDNDDHIEAQLAPRYWRSA